MAGTTCSRSRGCRITSRSSSGLDVRRVRAAGRVPPDVDRSAPGLATIPRRSDSSIAAILGLLISGGGDLRLVLQGALADDPGSVYGLGLIVVVAHRRHVGEGPGAGERRAGRPQLGRGCLSAAVPSIHAGPRTAAPARRAARGGPRARGEAGGGGVAELRPVSARGARARRARARGSSAPGSRGGPCRCSRRSTTRRGSWTSRSRSPGRDTSRSSARRGSRSARSGTCLPHVRHQPGRLTRGAATEIEQQAVRWVSEFVGYPATIGAFTSGGTISERDRAGGRPGAALPGARTDGLAGRRLAVYCSAEVALLDHPGRGAARASARTTCARLPIDARRRLRPDALAEALDATSPPA